MTRIIHIRNAPADWRDDLQYVYIGRAGHGLNGYFGNPYTIGKDGDRAEVLEKYENHMIARCTRDGNFAQALEDLQGKTLVCFCAPKRCHGNVIADFIDNLEQE